MAYVYKFTEEEVNELLGEDLSLAASLATLINENGNIRAFLVKKLEEREEEADRFHLQSSDSEDWNAMQDAVDAREARYITAQHFG